MSEKDNVYRLSDGSSIVKGAKGQIKKHMPGKAQAPSNLLSFKPKFPSALETREPMISYAQAQLKFAEFLESKRESRGESDSSFLIEEDVYDPQIHSNMFVNHALIVKNHKQTMDYDLEPTSPMRSPEGEYLGVLLRFEDKMHLESKRPHGSGRFSIYIASLELEPWIAPIDRGRGIEYRCLMQELEKPSIVNGQMVDFWDVQVSVADDNTVFATELIQYGWEAKSQPSREPYSVFQKRIKVESR